MGKFSDFVNNQINDMINNNPSSEKNLSQDDLEKLINKYSSYNQNDLIGEFMRLTYEKKRNGELSASDIDNIKRTIIPFLNDEQKNNLEKLLSMVENV